MAAIRRKQDNGLRAKFRKNCPEFQVTPIETWALTQGVPDLEYCAPGGISGWVELKSFGKNGEKPALRPAQIGWMDRRKRLGGRVFVLVERPVKCETRPGSSKNGESYTLHLMLDFKQGFSLDNLSPAIGWAEVKIALVA